METKVLAEPVLVGRERELEELKRYLNLAIDGKGTTVFISGEAGVGKTKLLNEFLKSARKEDITILTGWCLSDATVPYFPFVEAFNSYLSTDENDGASAIKQRMSLKSWLLESNQLGASEELANMQPQTWRDRAFHGVANELLFLSSERPLVLALEDVHWADSASISLLHYLARQVGSERILVICTFRSEELASDVEGHPNPLSKVLRLMGRDDLYSEIRLSNLSVVDVGKVAKSMLRGSPHPKLVEKIAIESQGNPLFVVESLRMLYQQGSLIEKDGQWSFCVDDFDIPRKVRDVIFRRLEWLRSDEREILDVASVVGEKFDPRLVATIVSQDNAEILRSLNNIMKHNLLVCCDSNTCWFEHPKFREMLYTEIPLILRKEYHLKIAEKIEAANIPETLASDLAYHFVNAGSRLKAIKYSLQAGKASLSRFSNMEAVKHFSYVVDSVKNDPELITERLIAMEGLGDAFYANSMFKESMSVYENLCDAAGNDELRLRALRKAMDSAFQGGDASHLMELVNRAEPYAAADRLESARVLFSRGRAFILQNMMLDALKDEKAALQVFEEEYSLWDLAFALIGVGISYSFLGSPQQGLVASLRSIAMFEEIGDFRWQMEAYWTTGIVFALNLLVPEALGMFEKTEEINERMKLGDIIRLVKAYMNFATALQATDDFQKALLYSLRAHELSMKTDSLWADGMICSQLTTFYALLGDMEHAKNYFEKLMKLPPENILPWVCRDLAKAVIYAGNCQWEESDRHFKKYFKWLKTNWKNSIGNEVTAKLFYAWALERQGRFAEAQAQRNESQKIRRDAERRFEYANIQANLMAPARVRIGETFEARVDIVNVSRTRCLLSGIENLLDPNLTVVRLSSDCRVQNSLVDLSKEALTPFQVKTVKLSLEAKQLGEISLAPKLVYIDNLKKTTTSVINKVTITVVPAVISAESEIIELPRIKFKSDDAERALDFLIDAFREDYTKLRLPLQESGWRTLMGVVKNGQVSKHSMYGRSGKGGAATLELGYLGLVESRFFRGERGRGGRILKLRIYPEKEYVKRSLNQLRG